MIEVRCRPGLRGLDSFRAAARALFADGIAPDAVRFVDEGAPASLFDAPWIAPPTTTAGPVIPRAFLDAARLACCHVDPRRYDVLYRALVRIAGGERDLLDDPLDPDARTLHAWGRAVRHDEHRTHAFVRFAKLPDDGAGERFLAWHEPEHHTVELAAPFFARRFAVMRWSILTPKGTASWDREHLVFGDAAPKPAMPDDPVLEELWRTYYGAIFNPARASVAGLARHVPHGARATLPEARDMDALLRASSGKTSTFIAATTARHAGARPFVPHRDGRPAPLPILREAATSCAGCALCEVGTQTVFGEGPEDARVVLVGEQPGDDEDRAGRPFVGPAGRILDDALAQAGLDRSSLYLTNAVKHFKHRVEGKRRLHERPTSAEAKACRPWLEAEIQIVKPDVLVLLGATAAKSLLGPRFSITEQRGVVQRTSFAPSTIATYHPAAPLRAQDPDEADRIRRALVEDLRAARRACEARRAEDDRHSDVVDDDDV